MSSNLYTHQGSNIRKTWLLMFFFLLIVIGVGWVVSWYYDSPAILVGFVLFSIIMNIVSYWFSDKIVLKMHKARPANEATDRELINILENLSITAGLPMPKLYVVDDPAPNAFATGRDKEHAVVAVTTGLVQILERNELEGVIAHELSHIGNRDMLLSTVVVVLVGFVTLISDFFLRTAFHGGGDRDNKAGGALAIIGIVFAILAPLIATLMQLAISRKREFLADASGALLTRYPDGLASALTKINNSSIKMKRANHATAHLFISNPFGPDGHARGFLNKMFMTHPPMEDRVAALLGHKLGSK
jgi:heat shock protein HtpX